MTQTSREKLNSIHIAGAVCVAAIFGGAAGSWLLFLLVAAVLIGASVVSGEIRPPRGGIGSQPTDSRWFRNRR